MYDRAGNMETFGLFEDSLDVAFRKRHGRLPTVLERLACIGPNGMGALVYDFTYSDGPNGWQTLSVAGVGENPAQADLDRLVREIGL